jgi:LacI family transcriptional regulator
MRVTMHDVAEAADVSVATVSHVVNATRFVSDPVRARVVRAIEETGYRRDAVARALKRSRTDSVGLVVSDTGHPIFAEMVRGVEEVAREHNLTLILSNSSDDPEREAAAVDALRQQRVDGLLIVPAVGATQSAQTAAEDGLPVVVMDRLVDAPIDQVGVDSAQALHDLTGHLADQGHRRIAVVAGTQELNVNVERLAACRAALLEHGLNDRDILVLTSNGHDGTYHPVRSARESVLEHLGSADPATGYVTLNAHQTVGTLEALQDAGISIPSEVGLVAFDDLPWSRLLTPSLTCAAQPASQIGREAMRLLARRIEHAPSEPTVLRLACEIKHRESCGCGRPGAPLVGDAPTPSQQSRSNAT